MRWVLGNIKFDAESFFTSYFFKLWGLCFRKFHEKKSMECFLNDFYCFRIWQDSTEITKFEAIFDRKSRKKCQSRLNAVKSYYYTEFLSFKIIFNIDATHLISVKEHWKSFLNPSKSISFLNFHLDKALPPSSPLKLFFNSVVNQITDYVEAVWVMFIPTSCRQRYWF